MEFLVVQATRIDYGRVYLQTILEEEEPSTSPAVDEKQATRTTKVLTFLSTRHLTCFTFDHRNMSWSSFSLSDANCFLQRVLPLFNLPLSSTKHLCITCEKEEHILWILFSYVPYQSPYRIYLPALAFKLGMTPALLRRALFFFVLGFLNFSWGQSAPENPIYIYNLRIPTHTTIISFHNFWNSS